MKIAWFTPFNKQSAIGRYSKFAAEALSKYAYVDIFTFENGNMHSSKLKVVIFTAESVELQLLEYDVAIYNIGDNGEYHAKIYDVMQRFPGILIDHDICLHNFMRYYLIGHKKNEAAYNELLNQRYGEKAANEITEAVKDYDDWAMVDFYKYSLSEAIADNALSVIVHSENHKRFMKQYYNGPINVITHLDTNDKLDDLDSGIDFSGYQSNKLHILTVGNVNRNKRIHKIIEALGKDSYLAQVRLLCYWFTGE